MGALKLPAVPLRQVDHPIPCLVERQERLEQQAQQAQWGEVEMEKQVMEKCTALQMRVALPLPLVWAAKRR
jgi:hypothetical protein